MGKVKLLILISLVLVFGFVPMINMPYEVVVQKQVSEEYTTVEPYTVQEEVQEPYSAIEYYVRWEEYTIPAIPGTSFGELKMSRPVTEQRGVTKFRAVTKEVTKYREVTKTRLVTRPVVETHTRRVSILRYLLR